MPLRRSCFTTPLALFVLPSCLVVACAQGTTLPTLGSGGNGGDDTWGAQSSSSSSGNGPGSSSSGSLSSSSGTSSGGGVASGSLAVVRVGDGSAMLTGDATPVYVEYFQTNGDPTPGKTPTALPTFASGSNWPLTLSGSSTAEGNLSLSSNGQFLLLVGYGADVGTTTVSGTDATIYPRVVGRIDSFGNVDTTTSLGMAFNVSSPRGATSTDGLSLWISGNGGPTVGGVHYATLGASGTTQILAAPSNTRFTHIADNQLYATSGAGTFVNVFAVGSGLPMSTGQTATPLAGMPTTTGPSPYSFAFVDRSGSIPGVDTLYVADDRSIANGGGIQRWVYDGSSWTNDLTFGDGTSGVRGLAAAVEGNGVRIIATTSEAAANRILSIFDEPGFSPTIVPIATAPTNTLYRGIAFAPK